MHTVNLDQVTRHNGVAGQYSYDVVARFIYDDPDIPHERVRVTFVGSEYGAPVVYISETFGQQFVSDWTRYGDILNPDWIRNFYGITE